MIFQRKIHHHQSPTLRSVVGGVEGARGRRGERLRNLSPLSSLVKKESKKLIFEKAGCEDRKIPLTFSQKNQRGSRGKARRGGVRPKRAREKAESLAFFDELYFLISEVVESID